MIDPVEIAANQIIDTDKQSMLGLSKKADIISINEAITPGKVVNGQVIVTTAGTRVALGVSTLLVNGVTIKAFADNTGIVYVGSSTVSSSNGYRLNAGESVFIAVDNLADIYVDASANTQKVSFIGG